MYFYIIEPDEHQVPQPVYYYGRYHSLEGFIRDRKEVTYAGMLNGKHILHTVNEFGHIDVIEGSEDEPVFTAYTALVEAQRWNDRMRSVSFKYRESDGSVRMLDVKNGIITDRSV